MREKSLGLMAKVLPHMFARWRLPEDFETLADLPDGEIQIDVLEGTVRHAVAGPIALQIARELKSGLESQLQGKGIGTGEISGAMVIIQVDTTRVKTDRRRIVHFDFAISSRITCGAELYAASQDEEHVWHSRPDRPDSLQGPSADGP